MEVPFIWIQLFAPFIYGFVSRKPGNYGGLWASVEVIFNLVSFILYLNCRVERNHFNV